MNVSVLSYSSLSRALTSLKTNSRRINWNCMSSFLTSLKNCPKRKKFPRLSYSYLSRLLSPISIQLLFMTSVTNNVSNSIQPRVTTNNFSVSSVPVMKSQTPIQLRVTTTASWALDKRLSKSVMHMTNKNIYVLNFTNKAGVVRRTTLNWIGLMWSYVWRFE